MNRAIALLIPFAFAACGDPEVGDTCDADADCEGGTADLFCDMAEGDTEGTCEEVTTPVDTDTDAA